MEGGTWFFCHHPFTLRRGYSVGDADCEVCYECLSARTTIGGFWTSTTRISVGNKLYTTEGTNLTDDWAYTRKAIERQREKLREAGKPDLVWCEDAGWR